LILLALLLLTIPRPTHALEPRPGATQLPVWIYCSPALEAESARPSVAPVVSPRAIARLERTGIGQSRDGLGNRALPASFLRLLAVEGITVRRASRALRAVSADITPEAYARLMLDPRVAAIEPRAQLRRPALREGEARVAAEAPSTARSSAMRPDPRSLTPSDYGPSWPQSEQIGINRLHESGYAGDGVLIAVLDGGADNLHPALLSADVVAIHDFVGDDSVVSYTPNDPDDVPDDPFDPYPDAHGTYTWTTVGGFAPGHLVGPAYRASFAFARTEQTRDETRIEEDNYVAGIEWADSLGADVVSTSLGYLDFPNVFSYAPGDLDGRTAVTTRAAAWAARRGIVVVVAAGNEGPNERTLLTPADAESVLSVGAVDFLGTIARFSSRGPTADGRIKPDVCARGRSTVCGSRGGGYVAVDGTSLATPLVAGLAALVRQAHPEWSVMEVIEHVRQSGDRAATPNNTYGYGIPDGFRAADLPGGSLVLDRAFWSDGAGLDSSATPDPDSLANPGDQGVLRLVLRNAGLAPSVPTKLNLRSLTASISPQPDTLTIEPLAAGESRLLPDSLGLRVATAAESPIFAPLYLELRGEDGSHGARRVSLLVAPDRWYDLSGLTITEDRGRLVARFRLTHGIAIGGARIERERAGVREILSDYERLDPGKAIQEIQAPEPANLEGGFYIRLQLLGGILTSAEGPVAFQGDLSGPVHVRGLKPNPVRPGRLLTVTLRLPGPSEVDGRLVDPTGREVATVWRAFESNDGSDLPSWPLPDRLASGSYWLRIRTQWGTVTRRLLVLR